MEMAEKRMVVQIPWRLLILIGTPVRVTANVDDSGVTNCFAVWLIGVLFLMDSSEGTKTVTIALHLDLINVCAGFVVCRSCDRHGRARYGPVLFSGLFEETCVRSRAETRESIAQNQEGEKEGARDRVVTELDLQLL